MKNSYVKKLVVLFISIFIVGMLLILSLIGKESIVDRSIVIGLSEQIFVLMASLIVFVALLSITINMYKQHKKLISLDAPTIPVEDLNVSHSIDFVETKQTESYFENEESTDESRFFMLRQIDKEAKLSNYHAYDNDITFEELCNEFRYFAAGTLGLYYDIKDIRRFVGGLTVSRIMILQGMSGTGKTSLAYAFGEYLNNSSVVIPIQPMWKERTDLIGYYNEFTKKFNETTLLQKLYEASHDEQMYITILDEMNIARVEYYFAEFLSLLEIPDHTKRYLDVISDVWDTDPELLHGGKLILPNNMWFIGTANNDDSTFAISDKVYDRAMVMNLDKKAQSFLAKPISGRKVTAAKFEELIARSRKKYALSNRNLRRLKELDKYMIKQFHISFGNRIMGQIINYTPVIVACGGTELQALDDIMSKKVLRKLETKNMVYVKSEAPGLIAYIEELFGEGEMEQCIEYIRNIEINA